MSKQIHIRRKRSRKNTRSSSRIADLPNTSSRARLASPSASSLWEAATASLELLHGPHSRHTLHERRRSEPLPSPSAPKHAIRSNSLPLDTQELNKKPSNAIVNLFPGLSSTPAEADANPDLPLLGSTHNIHEEAKTCFDRFKGMLAMIFGTMILSFNFQILYYVRDETQLNLKYSKSCYLMWTFTLYTIINLVPVFVLLFYNKEGLMKPFQEGYKTLMMVMLRGLLGSFALYIIWTAIEYFGKPAPVSVIMSMAPIVVYINAYFVLNEKLGIVPIVNAGIAIIGVVVMNLDSLFGDDKKQKFKPKEHGVLIGSSVALVSMYLLSWVFVVIRMVKDVHVSLINLSFGVFGILVMTTVTLATSTWKFFYEWTGFGFAVLVAVNSTINNCCFTYALKHEQAGVVSLMRTSEVIFQFLYQYLLFGISPNLFVGLGAALIILGVICVSLRKVVIESAEDSKIRKYLYFLKY